VIDTKMGAVGNTPLQTQITSLGSTATAIEQGMAILATGNTHVAITSGQYVFVRNHSTLANGLYKASANIAANAALSTSNLVADSSGGGLNSLKADLDTLNSNITPKITGNTASDSNTNNITYPTGRNKSNIYPISVGFYRNANWVFNNSAYQISLTNSNIVLELDSNFEYFRGMPYVIMYR